MHEERRRGCEQPTGLGERVLRRRRSVVAQEDWPIADFTGHRQSIAGEAVRLIRDRARERCGVPPRAQRRHRGPRAGLPMAREPAYATLLVPSNQPSRTNRPPMSPRVLVAYATEKGSTREVAEAIAARLKAEGLETVVQPARACLDLRAFDGVVLGGALYTGRWHRDARRFLRRHRRILRTLPVAVYGMGPPTTDDESMGASRRQLEHALARRHTGRRGDLRRRDRPGPPALRVQPDARLRRPGLGRDRRMGG